MEKVKSQKLSAFLIAIILITGSLIVLKIFNNSYALPEPKAPIINSIEKTSENPLQVKLNYTLEDVEDAYNVSILNVTETKTYTEYVTKTEGENEYLINDLEKGKTYEFIVKMCLEDTCKESNKESISIPADTPEPTPSKITVGKISNLRTTNITSNTISLKWNAATNATSYKLKYKKTSASSWYEHNIPGTTVNIKSLKPNTKYNVMIVGTRNGVELDNNNWVSMTFQTNPSVPNVTGFSAKAVSHSQVELKFKKKKNKKLYFVIYRSTNNKNWTQIKTLSATKTSYINKKLSANKTYYYKMRVLDKTTRSGKWFYGNYTASKKVKTPSKNSKTYILVSIKKQKLWFYKKGKLVLKSNVVTGTKGHTNTPKGTYKIRGKSRSAYLVGRDYVSFVNYWMLIDGGSQIGLHDATWRSSFGGSIYKYNGSHGCINLPYKVAKKIYKKAPVGTKVIVK